MNRILLDIVKNNHFDLVFLAKADTINYKILREINNYSKTFYYFVDPIKIAYSINAFKYASLTTWASASTTAMNLLFKRGGAKSYYILEGFNEKLFSSGENNKHKIIDVIFVGSITSDRKKYVNYLTRSGINVECFGRGWENKPIFFEDLVKKYRNSKIVLNFPREDSGFSDRVFQVMGTGSFLLSKYCSDLKRVFKRKIHLDWFETPEECINLIKFYLENDEIREKIAQEGHNYVLKNYTWEKMVQKINNIITE
jgi:glycosyltransferase involved in cell wall biosynthesis